MRIDAALLHVAEHDVVDLVDALLLGEGEGGVLLGVGGQDVCLVAGDVGVVEPASQRGGDVEVPDLVAGGVAVDADDAALGLAVLVGAQANGHGDQLPR